MNKCGTLRGTILGMALAVGWLDLAAAPSDPARLPPFKEVYGVIQSNLVAGSEEELNRAAVLGMVGQLQSRVTLVTNGPTAAEDLPVPLVSKTTSFDSLYGFIRIAKVGEGLPAEVTGAYQQLRTTNKLNGLILDLRFALGQDYAAAVDTADLFFRTEQPVLKWGETIARSTEKNSAIDLPLVVLINRETSGAAEALAAALRQRDGTLVIGSPSAGRAYVFRDFPLSNGQVLRVASGMIGNGQGEKLPDTGFAPDIQIAVNLEDEKAYFEDPYRAMAKPFAAAARLSTNDLASGQSTNRPRRRLNEAELVRMQREGMDFDLEAAAFDPVQPPVPVVHDPALARGLDLLKGLALASKRP